MKLYRGGLLDNQDPPPRIRPLSAARSCDTIDHRGDREWHSQAPWPRWAIFALVALMCAASFGLGVLLASGGTRP